MSDPFHFKTQIHLPRLLGISASSPLELLDGIKKVPASSIYYHTHHFLLKHHYLSLEHTNDFAYWLSNILRNHRLGERMAGIDIVSFRNLEDMRGALIKGLEEGIKRSGSTASCESGEEFHFMSAYTVVLPTPFSATNIEEFLKCLEMISINSLYFHFFEATLRLGKNENDFTSWLKSQGASQFALKISDIDPYSMTLEDLRKQIIKIGRKNNHAAS